MNLSNFTERLKELMDEADINIPQLSSQVHIEQSAISRFLKAERLPTTASLVALADFFQCTTDYLLGQSDVLDERQFQERPPFDKRLNFLLDYFHITKYRLEKGAHLSEETVNRWQKGKHEPNPESLIKLSDYLKCSVDFILGREK